MMVPQIMDNKQAFNERKEPEVLKPVDGSYISLRTCNDLSILRSLEGILSESEESLVIASWYTPPYGKVLGYGLYGRQEAVELSKISKAEKWGAPRFGAHYDLGWVQRRIERITYQDTP